MLKMSLEQIFCKPDQQSDLVHDFFFSYNLVIQEMMEGYSLLFMPDHIHDQHSPNFKSCLFKVNAYGSCTFRIA